MSPEILAPVPTLDSLLNDLSRVGELSGDEARALCFRLRDYLVALPTAAPPTSSPQQDPEQWLNVEEVAQLTGLSPRQIWARSNTRAWASFTRKISRKTVRFSKEGFLKWQRSLGAIDQPRLLHARHIYDSPLGTFMQSTLKDRGGERGR